MKMATIAATVSFKAMFTSYHNGYIELKPFQKNELSKPQNRNKKTTQKTTTKIPYIRSIERRAENTVIQMPNEMIASTIRNAKIWRDNLPSRITRRTQNRESGVRFGMSVGTHGIGFGLKVRARVRVMNTPI
jgi:hypothetical protein